MTWVDAVEVNKKTIREDINGLRALAVISVLIFHFSHGALPGGYAGVDVFFVISGFLMTSIIIRGTEDSSFKLWAFYLSRAARIIPAVAVVVALVLIAGYVFIEPLSYAIIGKHAASSLLFFSNYIYSAESGYFDLDAYDKFLLHTWSLSVEWQFYLIYPVIILALRRFLSLGAIKVAMVALTLASFALSVWVTKSDASSAYFMLHSRAWEMLAGGLVFLFPLEASERIRRSLEISGVVLIGLALFWLDDSTPWPGYMAALPVIGTCLVILANSQKTVFSGAVIQKLGLWSYSIYLLHWPIIVFFKKLGLNVSFPLYLAVVIAASFGLYHIVESKRGAPKRFMAAYGLIMLAAMLVYNGGAGYRVDNSIYKLNLQQYRDKYEGHAAVADTPGVQYFNATADDFDYILIGDSHARHYFSYIINSGKKVASFARNGCYSIGLDASANDGSPCYVRAAEQLEFIKKHPGKKVIVAFSWPPGFEQSGGVGKILADVNSLVNAAGVLSSNFYVVSKINGSPYVALSCLSKQPLPIYTYLEMIDCPGTAKKVNWNINAKMKSWIGANRRVHFIDISIPLCKGEDCLIWDKEGTVYTDNSHLTRYGSDKVGSYIFKQVDSK
ncbi:acyltransferase family protein [Pseudomonas proteolytica]|uniref:acyltransferase family protein n=1 Tax=Pseudomonas proteolytica TaxID=219574 RepID=UPI0014743887|nr:acyltransferase family protein [Pseudomonas proteolytica]NMZ35355.1 acyltransferase [Pseudomonas proteolytica]